MTEPSPAEPARLMEALDAYLRALEAGEAPDRDEVLARHPDLADELGPALDGLDFVHRAGRSLASDPADAPPEAASAGTMLGEYRLVREIGRGGMAVVYEAEQVSLGRRVALKVLPFAAVLDPRRLQRFRNEALAAAHLHHPNIVPVYAVGCERGVHYYAMQYVEGQSLAVAIREMREGPSGEGPRTPLSSSGSHRSAAYIRLAAEVGRRAAEALDHAHHLGIVHRDVKPGNLLVDGTGTVWVADFGLARTIDDVGMTRTGELLGTVRYMSPEQALARRAPVDHRTDVYSLGATLYELLTLEPAFPGDDVALLVRDVATREPVPPRRRNPAIPRDVETVILKAMSKDPSARYATAQDMADDLGRVLADEPVRARRPSLAAHVGRWSRRNRRVVAACFVAMALAIGGLVAYGVRVGSEQAKTAAALETAQANFGLARGAVDKYLVEAGVANLEDRPLPPPARRALLEAALRLDGPSSGDPTATPRRVTVLHALHRYGEAEAALDEVLAKTPEDAWALVQRAHMRYHTRRFPEALADADRAVALAEAWPEAHYFRALVLGAMGNLKTAIEDHDRASTIGPDEPRFHYGKGNALRDLGRPLDAIAEYTKAIGLSETFAAAYSARGTTLDSLGRSAEALKDHDRAVDIDRDYAEYHTFRGLTLVSLGDLAGGERAHRQAIALDDGLAEAHTHLGMLLLQTGRTEEAVAANQRAVDLRPDLVPARTNLANALVARSRFDEGVRAAAEAVRMAPERATSHFVLGTVHHQRGAYDDALACYRLAAELDPKLAIAHVHVANVLLETGGDPAAAEAEYRAAVAANASCTEAWGGLGNVLRDRRDFAGALEAYRRVIGVNPKYAVGQYCVGTMLSEQGLSDGAVEAFRRAIAVDPEFAGAHVALGRELLMTRGDLAGALAAFEEAGRLDPTLADAHNLRGVCHKDLGHDGLALQAYQDALDARPDHPETLSNLGRALNDVGEHEAAIRACRKAITIQDLPEAHLNLGNALMDTDRVAEAIVHFRRAIDLRPDFALAYNGLGCALADTDPKAAIEAYGRAIQFDPRLAPAHHNLANALFRAGDDDGAEREYRAALSIEGGLLEAWVGLGRVLLMRKRPDLALPVLRHAQEMGVRRGRWPESWARLLALAERRVELAKILDRVVAGELRPRDATEEADLAEMLHPSRRHAAAVRMYEHAFAECPALASDLRGHRYNAACNAVLAAAAAAGAGDAAALRAKALAWLKADLLARKTAPPEPRAVLADWRRDSDLASVRDGIDALPEDERDAWRRLWADVDAALEPEVAAR